jgi:F420-dependent oxidoreductase-like protein
MRIGVSLSTFAAAPGTVNVVDRAVELGAQAEGFGLDAVWFGQMASYDAVAVASAVGRAVPRIMVGPSVVPLFPRHPQLLASAAKTAQAATGGRFQLGVGLGGAYMESVYGLPYPPPARHLREYLTALRPLLAGRAEAYEGETVVSRPLMATAVAGAEPEIPVIVAAMGPQALKATGELADGALPFLAGPRTLGAHIVPALTAAAEAAGRPAPRVVAAIAAVVTDDVERTRAAAVEQMAFYEGVPSYRRVLDLEGAGRAGELAVIGDEETVAAEVRRYLDAGATEVTLAQTDMAGEADRVRTWRLAGELARG